MNHCEIWQDIVSKVEWHVRTYFQDKEIIDIFLELQQHLISTFQE